MILPTKGIPPDAALLTVAGEIIFNLAESKTVSRLWDEMRKARATHPSALPFDWFVLALDLLFMVGVVDYHKGRVVRMPVPTPTEAAP